MANDAKRTPGKWRYSRVSIGCGIFDEEGELVARMCKRNSDDEAAANAAFIVRACNAHDALVAASQATLAWLGSYFLTDASPAKLFMQVEAAIAEEGATNAGR